MKIQAINVTCPKYGRKQSLLVCHIIGRCKDLERCSKMVEQSELNESLNEYAKEHSSKFKIGGLLAKTTITKLKIPLLLIPKSIKIRKDFKAGSNGEIVTMDEEKLKELTDNGEVELSTLNKYNIIQATKYGRAVILTLKKVERK